MPDSSPKQLAVFSLGSEEYALPIGAVHEIIRHTEPRTVASRPRAAADAVPTLHELPHAIAVEPWA